MSLQMCIGNMFGFLRRYPVKVQVLSKRGNAIQITSDKASRIIEQDGTQYYHLKKHKLKIKPPEYKYFFVGKKGKPILFLYSPQQGQMLPVNIDNPPNLTIEDKETIFWGIQQIKRTLGKVCSLFHSRIHSSFVFSDSVLCDAASFSDSRFDC